MKFVMFVCEGRKKLAKRIFFRPFEGFCLVFTEKVFLTGHVCLAWLLTKFLGNVSKIPFLIKANITPSKYHLLRSMQYAFVEHRLIKVQVIKNKNKNDRFVDRLKRQTVFLLRNAFVA